MNDIIPFESGRGQIDVEADAILGRTVGPPCDIIEVKLMLSLGQTRISIDFAEP